MFALLCFYYIIYNFIVIITIMGVPVVPSSAEKLSNFSRTLLFSAQQCRYCTMLCAKICRLQHFCVQQYAIAATYRAVSDDPTHGLRPLHSLSPV